MLDQSSAGCLAGPTPAADLVLERLPNGEYAWLRPECSEVRYVLTQRGQDLLARWRAERWLFGAEVS